MKIYRLTIQFSEEMYTTKDTFENDFNTLKKAQSWAKKNGLEVDGETGGRWAINDGMLYNAEDVEKHWRFLDKAGSPEFDCAYTHLEVISSEKDVDKLTGAILDIIQACEEMDIDIGAVDDAQELLKGMGVK